jgi:hypothetical protein
MDYLCVVSISCASLSRLRQAEKEKGKLWGKSFLTFLFFFLFIQNHAHIYTEREREKERKEARRVCSLVISLVKVCARECT